MLCVTHQGDKAFELAVMDADSFFDEVKRHDALSIPENLHNKLACSSSETMQKTLTNGLSVHAYACPRSDMVHDAYASGLPTPKPLQVVESQNKNSGHAVFNKDCHAQSPQNFDRPASEAAKALCFNTSPSLALKCPNFKETLAGLIFMSNDTVRRSYLKYHVFGMPISRRHVVDRLTIGTKLFLFEFESRQLWGVYEATSEMSLDIEKDAYQASSAPLPAQVTFRVLKKCRPLPERLFKHVIQDNYFTSIKFNSELTAQQVSSLIQLYDCQAGELYGATRLASENSVHVRNDYINALIDSSKLVYNKGPFFGESIGVPHKRRLMDRDDYDYLKRASLKLEKTSDQIIQSHHIQRHAPLHLARPDIGSLSNSNATFLRLEAESTANKTPDFQAHDLIYRNGKAGLASYTGKASSESEKQGMINNVQISPLMGFVGSFKEATTVNKKRNLEGLVEEECLGCQLYVRPLVMQPPCKFCCEPDRNEQQYSCSHGEPYFVESREQNAVLGNMKKIVASPSGHAKCLANGPQPRGKKNDEEVTPNDMKDKLPYEQSSHCHLYDCQLGQNSRQLGVRGSPSLTEVVQQDVHTGAREENWASTSLCVHPTENSDHALPDPEAHGRERLHTDVNTCTPLAAKARKLSWSPDHVNCLIGKKAAFCPSTSKTLKGEAWVDHQFAFADDCGNQLSIDSFLRRTIQNNTLKSDDVLQDRELERVAKDPVMQEHMVDDDEDDDEWLERARSIVLKSLRARSNNSMLEDSDARREDNAQMHNHVQRSPLPISGWHTDSSDLQIDGDNAKPRGSVWSRLSFPRNTYNPLQMVSPNAGWNES